VSKKSVDSGISCYSSLPSALRRPLFRQDLYAFLPKGDLGRHSIGLPTVSPRILGTHLRYLYTGCEHPLYVIFVTCHGAFICSSKPTPLRKRILQDGPHSGREYLAVPHGARYVLCSIFYRYLQSRFLYISLSRRSLRDAVSYERGVSRDWTISTKNLFGSQACFKAFLLQGMGRVNDYILVV